MDKKTDYFYQTFKWKSDSKTDSKYIFIKNNVRFSVLTPRLLRVEYDKNGIFTDEPTQAIINRNFDKPEFKVIEDNNCVIIVTTRTMFKYDTAKHRMLGISLKGGKTLNKFNKNNLKGTYRTLDATIGEIKLGDGLMSRDGVAVYDDSKSLILNENGTIGERLNSKIDEYYFAYNHDYRGCLKDFFSLSGEVPLVPRYCLGNWWSRYKAYTQQEYVDLMNKFIEKEIPITVATIDMDWHWVDVKERFFKNEKLSLNNSIPENIFQGDGWTGYSWNTELFPDYKGFLKWLKDKNFKITVNLHPAQGVRYFEDMYEDFAKAMGVDPATKKRIKFDITDPRYIDAYFNILHKPYEDQGVDFWWIDWQQGKNTKLKNLDPLWALNHYHTLANNKDNNRPLILSRYAEIGSHRYPLGFSGDTAINWDCLKFQPYFTSTATNVGYTWWSHDIGGHHQCSKDDELYTRWVEYGLYSPIMRLHSTSNEFMGKEPWKHNFQAEQIAVRTLRERHALIPYLYSMNYRTHKNCLAICEPMYYAYPETEEAYNVRNQYFFGTELLIAPITEKINPKTFLASTDVWLPEGRWTDIYTGAIYEGGKKLKMYRGIESIPVLAKEGAIIPLSSNDRDNNSDNPKNMTVRVYRGNNSFELYEDDGITKDYQNGNFAKTLFENSENGNDVTFTINSASGNCSTLPKTRKYTLVFEDILSADEISVEYNGKEGKFDVSYTSDKMTITLESKSPKTNIIVSLKGIKARANKSKKEMIIELVTKYQLPVALKKAKFEAYLNDLSADIPAKEEIFRGPIQEVIEMA